MKKRLISLSAIGLLVFLAVWLVIRAVPYQVNVAQVAASDWIMVDAHGLRLGARPARYDITLVMYDVKTAADLGYVRSYEDDLQLYAKLFAAGARCVYDTRPVAAADEAGFAEVLPLLDGMLELRDDGTLSRDIYLGTEILSETHPRYANLISQNLVNAYPHAIPSIRSRYYPMFCLTAAGLNESAPLRVARQIWGLAPGEADSLAEQVRLAGVMSAWHQQAPDTVPETDEPAVPYVLGNREIPWYPFLTTTILVPPAAFWVNYDPAVEAYSRHSYIDLFRGDDLSSLRDKIAIIGFSPETDISPDSYEVPSAARKAAAAEVMAVALQTLLDEQHLRVPPVWLQYAVIGFMCVAMALLGGLFRPLQAVLAAVAVLVVYVGLAVLAYRSGWFSDLALAPAAGVVSGFLGFVYSSWLSVRSRQRVVDLFGRYVPRAVVNQLMLQPELKSLVLGGVKQDMTVMFADIRGFTTFSEDLPPEEVVRQLNSLLEIMVECTFENEGTLDKFIGDAILVLFNAPLHQQDHVTRAVRTALAIQQRLAQHPTGLTVGIGLHRGEAVVGNIGTQRRLEYTAIGSTVNIASRLCGVAEPGEVIISAAMLDELSDDYATEALAPVTVKGIKAPLEAFRVMPRQTPPTP